MLQAYLEEQARLSAVDRFSAAHDRSFVGEAAWDGGTEDRSVSASVILRDGDHRPNGDVTDADGADPRDGRNPSKYYRELLPRDVPGQNEQYAFEVDLDRCTGCKACVTGCHNRNGLDDGETWRMVGAVRVGAPEQSITQTVTTACHHCADPGCLSGCPVLAYEKDEATGIVVHLDDQCIGCRYCTMKCPYDVPQYDEQRGIVRKCDLCIDRLADGEAPACAAACPTEAIRIVTVPRDRGLSEAAEGFRAVPGSPDPAFTLPTTRYKTQRGQAPHAPSAEPLENVTPEEAHLPLVAMLVLTQAAVGASLASCFLTDPGELGRRLVSSALPATLAALLAVVGVGASISHLGRPLYAFRAFLGFRTSWLSREILAFGAYVALALGHAGFALAMLFAGVIDPATGSAVGSGLVPALDPATGGQTAWFGPAWFGPAFLVTGWGAALVGVFAVFCSAMVYFDTPRRAWSSPQTFFRFGRTTVLSALVVSCMTALLGSVVETSGEFGTSIQALNAISVRASLAALLISLALVADLNLLAEGWGDANSRWHVTARVVAGPMLELTSLRIGLALLGVVGLATMATSALSLPNLALGAGVIACLALMFGELCERHLFFVAVDVPRMPGTPSPRPPSVATLGSGSEFDTQTLKAVAA